MEDKKQIFIVTKGEYSEYHIDRVFSTSETAEEYLDTKDDDYTLEVFDIDKPIERKTEVYCISFCLDKKKAEHVKICWRKSMANLINVRKQCWDNAERLLDIYVESDSRKRALKVASERYGSIIANEQTMYPYLRVGVIDKYGSMESAFFDFNTGELVLVDRQELAVELPAFVKVRKLDDK